MLTTAHERLIQFQRIAVLSDLRSDAETMVRYSAAVARWYGSELLLVHAAPAPTDRPGDVQLSSLIDRFNLHDLAPKVIVRKLDAGMLLTELQDYHPGLLVLATHGQEEPRQWLAGSAAETVFHSAPWPVLVLGPGIARGRPEPQKQFERILYATDLSAVSVSALQYAGAIAHDHEAELIALYVESDGKKAFFFGKTLADLRLSDWMQDRINGLAETLAGVHCVVDFGRPEQKILEAAAQHKADLIILGARGSGASSGGTGCFLGGTAYKVICWAACPVLIVPQPR